MLTSKLLIERASLHATLKGLSDGQTTSSSAYSFCRQQGSCGSNNQNGTEILYYATSILLQGEKVESK